MGVKGLWSLLTPFCDRRPLYELQGQTIAIDLAGWVCEALTIVDYNVQPRFYLRNLFFRTSHLLQLGVHPVFVLDGVAPQIKYGTIAARNLIQFKGAKPRTEGTEKGKEGKDRSRFKSVLRQCEELLNIIGIKCVQGWGEAEAMCAYLNSDGYVSACVSQDSDCFVYGARTVLRNFTLNGSIDLYDISKVPDLGRNKMVVLALLNGCDYNNGGVNGVGKDAALKFLESFDDEVILDRVKRWKEDPGFFEGLDKEFNDPGKCTGCGHLGKVQKHSRSGCLECGSKIGCCNPNFKERRLVVKNELGIREKAILDPMFPSQDIIDEFLVRKDKMPDSLDLSWVRPNLVQFVKFMFTKSDWTEIYSFEKFLPLVTRWHVLNVKNGTPTDPKTQPTLYPNFIKKKCRPKGIASFQIIWIDKDENFTNLLTPTQITEWTQTQKKEVADLWTTVEPEHLVEVAYPDLIQKYLDSKQKPVKKRKGAVVKKGVGGKKVKESELEDLNESMQRLFLGDGAKREKSKEPVGSEKGIGSKENTTKKRLLVGNRMKEGIGSKEETTKKGFLVTNRMKQLMEIQNLDGSLDLDRSDSDSDASDIVEGIVGRGDLNLLDLIERNN